MWINEGTPTREIKITLSLKDIARWVGASADQLHVTHVDKAPGSEHGVVRICLLCTSKESE